MANRQPSSDPAERRHATYLLFRVNHPRRAWATRAAAGLRYRAKARGLAVSIDAAWLERNLPVVCPVLGLPLELAPLGTQGCRPNSPTVDRIDNSRGYTPDNCVIVSCRANSIKGTYPLVALRAMADQYAPGMHDLYRIAAFYARLVH